MSDKQRTYVVTGADSGLGRVVAAQLAAVGRVIACGVGTAVDIRADLSTVDGRDSLVTQAAALSGGRVDGVVAVAGIGTPAPKTVVVNHFGTIAVLDGLRDCLAASAAPAAVVVSSSSTLSRGNRALIRACLRGDERRARQIAQRLVRIGLGSQIYRSSKIALNRWVRRTAVADAWTGAGIVLNAVAPGIIATEHVMRSWGRDRELLEIALPQPLGAPGPVESVADLIAYTVSSGNRFMTGQLIYCDGGTDALVRRSRPQQVFLRYSAKDLIAMSQAVRRRKAASEDATAVRSFRIRRT